MEKNQNNTATLPLQTTQPQQSLYLLEVGCGVGNAAFPLLEYNSFLHVVAIDFASSAVQLVKTNPLYEQYSTVEKRLDVQLCDITKDEVILDQSRGGLDLILCMYVLSAIPPEVGK